MTIHFTKSLQESLSKIQLKEHHEFLTDTIESYGEAKWNVVDLLNNNYTRILENKFDLFNWLNHNKEDEVSYFLNEAGSNSLNYSEHKMPHKFHLWLGEKGFIIGIEQLGEGFNPTIINKNRIKDNEGAAFSFFRDCEGKVFFDDSENAKTVYFKKLF